MVEEFREYAKHKGIHPPDLTKKELNRTVEEFALYMIERNYAVKYGFDSSETVLQKTAEYRNKLLDSIQNYKRVSEAEIQEAYNRMQKDRNVSHIQINFPDIPYPADTLEPYNKAWEIYRMLEKGEKFEQLAYRFSENPITKQDSGYIGPVSFGTLNYPMELVSFRIDPGGFSTPFVTWQGFQLMKINSEEPAKGFTEIAHIAMKLPLDNSKNERTRIIGVMDSLRLLITKGKSFSDLAQMHSEDESSSQNGGYLGYIPSSFMIREIAEAAFKLEKNGDVSPLVLTENSVHILRRLNFSPIPEFKDAHDSIRNVLYSNQAREYYKKNQFYDLIKSRSGYKSYPENVSDFLMLGKTCFQRGQWVMPADSVQSTLLFELNADKFTYYDLSKRMQKSQYAYTIRNYRPVIWKKYQEFEEAILDDYFVNNFEILFPEAEMKIKWAKSDIIRDSIISREILEKLPYSTEDLEDIYRKNKKKYNNPDIPGQPLSFDSAFQMVLSDYQAEALRKWENELLKTNRIKTNKKVLKQLVDSY